MTRLTVASAPLSPASVRCGYLVGVAVLTAPTAVAARVGMTALVGAMPPAAAPGAPASVPTTGVVAATRVISMAATATALARGCRGVLAQRVILHDVLLPDVIPQ